MEKMKGSHGGQSGAEKAGAGERPGKVGGAHKSNGLPANMKERSICEYKC
jgi:hypothetical protein